MNNSLKLAIAVSALLAFLLWAVGEHEAHAWSPADCVSDIVDSGSPNATAEIAEQCTAVIVIHSN